MMEEFKIVYIDDAPDTDLSRFLDDVEQMYTGQEYNFESTDIIFKSDQHYDSLLKNYSVQTANIIVIDSRLFEDQVASDERFSGEEFKIVLQKFYPFIEVIVVTQNDSDAEMKIISKYVKNDVESGPDYYARVMRPYLNSAIQNILIYRKLANKVKENNSWETVLKENLLGTLQGTQTYDMMTKEDIDSLVYAFKEIRKFINGD